MVLRTSIHSCSLKDPTTVENRQGLTCRTCPNRHVVSQKVSSRCCSKLTILRSSIFYTERARDTHCMFVLLHVWPVFDVKMLDSIMLDSIFWCRLITASPYEKTSKPLNFSPTSFHPRDRRKFQRHLPQWSPGNAASHVSHTTLDAEFVGRWLMNVMNDRGVGYSLGGGFNHFLFSPYLGKWSNLSNIFQVGSNHQLVLLCEFVFFVCGWRC